MAKDGKVSITNFQIVNGCQTTVTLSKRTREELLQTHVDLKLVVADAAFAQNIAESSNSQTALRKTTPHLSDSRRLLGEDFKKLQPPEGFMRFKQGSILALCSLGQRESSLQDQAIVEEAYAYRRAISSSVTGIAWDFLLSLSTVCGTSFKAYDRERIVNGTASVSE